MPSSLKIWQVFSSLAPATDGVGQRDRPAGCVRPHWPVLVGTASGGWRRDLGLPARLRWSQLGLAGVRPPGPEHAREHRQLCASPATSCGRGLLVRVAVHDVVMSRSEVATAVRWPSVAVVLLVLCVVCGCTMPGSAPEVPPQRTLMVGNSFTFWNGGLWFPLQDMLGGNEEGVVVRPSVQGGASLATHAARRRLGRQLDEGDYDLVILQGDIPESTVEAFEQNAAALIARVRGAGAVPLLFMAWDYERLGWLSLQDIVAAHRRVTDASGVQLAPVGSAFLRVRDHRPDLDLYDEDREHPSLLGSYLALVILHATIMGSDPRANESMPRAFRRVDSVTAKDLRQIAWTVMRDERERRLQQ